MRRRRVVDPEVPQKVEGKSSREERAIAPTRGQGGIWVWHLEQAHESEHPASTSPAGERQPGTLPVHPQDSLLYGLHAVLPARGNMVGGEIGVDTGYQNCPEGRPRSGEQLGEGRGEVQ